MLLEAVHYMERKELNKKSLLLHGQEKNLNTWAICKMSMFLHDIDDARVAVEIRCSTRSTSRVTRP